MAALAIATLALTGCGLLAGPPTDAKTDQPIDLKSAEINEYQGKRLDSVADFRENSIKGPQDVDLDGYTLKVTGEVDTPLTLTYDEVIDRQSYKKVVTLNCVEGWSVDILWEGVRLADLLEQAGYDPDAKTVIFRCYDGYSTSLPLEKVVGQNLLFAYKMNGIDLPKERGLPVPSGRRGPVGLQVGEVGHRDRGQQRHGLQGLLGEPWLRERRDAARSEGQACR